MNRFVACALALITSASLASSPSQGATTEHFEGPFTSAAVMPPECTSAVGLCTRGLLYDTAQTLVATYDFTMDTLVLADALTQTFIYTGHSLITKVTGAQGTIIGSDHGRIQATATLQFPFVTTVEVVGGTGEYVGATGEFVAPGTLSIVGGTATGTYIGDVTTP